MVIVRQEKGMNSNTKIARVAGLLYLLVIAFALLQGYGFSSLVIPNDAAATAHNIIEGERLFRISFVSDLIQQTCFLLLVWTLYVLLKSFNKNLRLPSIIYFASSNAV